MDAIAQGNSGNHNINVEFNEITLLDVFHKMPLISCFPAIGEV